MLIPTITWLYKEEYEAINGNYDNGDQGGIMLADIISQWDDKHFKFAQST